MRDLFLLTILAAAPAVADTPAPVLPPDNQPYQNWVLAQAAPFGPITRAHAEALAASPALIDWHASLAAEGTALPDLATLVAFCLTPDRPVDPNLIVNRLEPSHDQDPVWPQVAPAPYVWVIDGNGTLVPMATGAIIRTSGTQAWTHPMPVLTLSAATALRLVDEGVLPDWALYTPQDGRLLCDIWPAAGL